MIWTPCTGGGPKYNSKGILSTQPCILIVDQVPGTDSGQATHKGTHNHPFVPNHKPFPEALRKFEEIVKAYPDAGPRKFILGSHNCESVADIDDAFFNQDRVKHMRKMLLPKTSTKLGINTLASIMRFNKHQHFIVDADIVHVNCQHITMQSQYMVEVLREGMSGLQSDTVEGVIDDSDYPSGNIAIHITSAYDRLLERWVPVLISIIFGRTKEHYMEHWKNLFKSYGDDVNQSWESLCQTFPGVTVDWSTALGHQSFIECLLCHRKAFGFKNIQRKDVLFSFKEYHVHFMQSKTLIS